MAQSNSRSPSPNGSITGTGGRHKPCPRVELQRQITQPSFKSRMPQPSSTPSAQPSSSPSPRLTQRRASLGIIKAFPVKPTESLQQQVDRHRRQIAALEGQGAAFVIDPTKLWWWDMLTAFALVFTAIVGPFEVAFLTPARSASDGLFILNRMIDTFFILDMVSDTCSACCLYTRNYKHLSQHRVRRCSSSS